ncbi:hypothetical protein IAR55_005235 [Kwoniella newhampshirensis]|uniref:Uncharacterized protein n=1 Tax=Kwoniella newhampshirensis TaxID=1651941 RepID=A0AAW0YVU6_9TREE
MMCLKHIMIYFLILPLPAASPFFLFLFAAAVFVAIRPCGYCITLLSILFFSSSPNSPFINHQTPTTNITLSSLPLIAPIPNRSWMTVNGGRLWDPSLVGYREMSKALARERKRSPGDIGSESSVVDDAAKTVPMDIGKTAVSDGGNRSAEEKGQGVEGQSSQDWGKLLWDTITLSEVRRAIKGLFDATQRLYKSTIMTAPRDRTGQQRADGTQVVNSKSGRGIFDQVLRRPMTSTPARVNPDHTQSRKRPLPPGYVDLSWKGIGFIVDFGWKRSEEGIKWEIEEVLGRDWERGEESALKGDIVQVPQNAVGEQGVSEEGRRTEAAGGGALKPAVEKASSFWSRVPLVGGVW